MKEWRKEFSNPFVKGGLFSRFDVGIDLRLQRVGEHPPCSGTGDLVEVEGEFFAGLAIVVYAEHRCSFPPTLQRRLFRLSSGEGTPPALRNLRSTTSEHISFKEDKI